MRRTRAAILTFTALVVLAAALFPSCGTMCCKRDATPTVHAQMPCCEPSVGQREARTQPTTAAAPHVVIAAVQHVAIVVDALPATQSATSIAAPAPQPTPPLFLLNEQFRI